MNWAIGDIHGCYDNLRELLGLIEFNPKKDKLWLVGDLVNRGDKSLEVLEYLISIDSSINIVLGNHDIALIASYYGLKKSNPTIEPILKHKDAKKFINWLRGKPLLHTDYNLGYAMSHAGIAPNFELGAAIYYNNILQKRLKSKHIKEWLRDMMSKDNHLPRVNFKKAKTKRFSSTFLRLKPPASYANSFKNDYNIEMERYALSSFTRMRYCYKNGYLDFKQKGSPKSSKRDDIYPWFDCPIKVEKELKILFGHWSTLGFLDRDDILALDTGCLWGGKLTAYSLEDKRRFSIPCKGI